MQSSAQSGSGQKPINDGADSSHSIQGLVQRHATIGAETLAVSAGSDRLTYRELEVRSNQLANFLRTKGVTAGRAVGLCMERSVAFPVAALAILKCAAAYLPLEPKSPSRRLQMMLETANVSVVLTNSSARETLVGDGRTVVALDDSAADISRSSSEAPNVCVTPDQLAYVIFTSGSTGTPKAVAIRHSSLLNLVHWHNRTFGVTAADRATQLASIGFDAAVWELWPYLAAGASVHLVDEDARTDAERLRTWLVREKITISFAPTPLAERMLNLTWPKETALRYLLTGADILHQYPPAGLPFTLVNNYGPTECTVVATSAAVRPQQSGDQLPPIGCPIDNAQVYILDSQMQRVANGAVGEIYVGGGGIGQGYLNDPALTAERFITNPFSAIAGDKLYRTGDLGRYLADGQIAFHGRSDDQVKINGFRVELNEVANALRRHPEIRNCTICARANEAGEKQLVAYVVRSAALPSVSNLREFLGKELPDYMFPAIFVDMHELPIGSSGKVDRLALPAPTDENMLRDEIFQAPQSATEKRVASIVATLLGLETVGVKDNFFYLGGNSLFGTQLIARLRDAFNVEVPLLGLFDHPTVAELAREVEQLIVAKLDAMSEEEAQRLLALNTEQASV